MASNRSSDTESLGSAATDKSGQNVAEIAANPNLNIFTSLVWVRKPGHEDDVPQLQEEIPKIVALDESAPDLGLLRYHRDRLAATADALKWHDIPVLELSKTGLDKLRSTVVEYLPSLPRLSPDQVEIRKLRILIKKTGEVTVDSSVMHTLSAPEASSLVKSMVPDTLEMKDTSVLADKCCQVFIDSRPCQSSLFTTHKTSHREHYDSARERADVSHSGPMQKEVMLYSQNGEVMETSLCTVYFFREGKWVTPAAACGGNLGVTLRVAKNKGVCQEGVVNIAEVQNGEKIWLSNGARGFFIGQICR